MAGRWQRVVLGFLVLLAFASVTAPQTVPVRKQTRKSAKPVQAVSPQSARPDSLAALRADSLKRVEEDLADSLSRAAEERARADSLETFNLRSVDQRAFGVGERLVFDVNYGFLTAGEAVISIPGLDTLDGRACYRVVFEVNSLPSFSWIYRVEDRYYTFIDVAAIMPWRFEQHIREGNYRRDFVADFDQYHHLAKTTEGDYAVPPYVHDIMSAFFYARTMDYSQSKPGDVFTLFNFYKDKTNELGVKFLGRQELEVEAGTFRTIVVEPMVKEGGLFKSEGRIVVWMTDDDLKVPIRVNTKVVIGSIDTELREFSGLRGELRSRVR
jgi:hypothetical protein